MEMHMVGNETFLSTSKSENREMETYGLSF